MRNASEPFDAVYLKDIYDRLQSETLPSDPLSTGERGNLKQVFISYMDTGSLIYQPDITLFTSDVEIKNEDDILSAKLGLFDGLAGKLIRTVKSSIL